MSTVLEHYTKEDLLSRTSIRQGEERLGQRSLPSMSQIGTMPIRYHTNSLL